MSLRPGGDIDGTLCTMGIGEPLYTWISWLYSDCVADYGYLGNSQVRMGTLGTICQEETLVVLYTSNRALAQFGSAPALGAGCRGFKSLMPDLVHHNYGTIHCRTISRKV